MPVNQSTPKKATEYKPVYESISVPEYSSRVTAYSSQSNLPLMNDPLQIKKQIIDSKNFNLRQAVIYNELLNPKYF